MTKKEEGSTLSRRDFLTKTGQIMTGLLLTGVGSSWNNSAKALNSQRTNKNKYLLFHVDGISSKVFQEELTAGNLKNLESFFSDGRIIKHGITYYPPFTQVVVSRIREGKGIEEGKLIDWYRYDPKTEEARDKLGVFRDMVSTVQRRSKSNFIYGVPMASTFGGLAMLNLPDLIKKYGAIEYYWFATDTYGHMLGEQALKESLRKFDTFFGLLTNNLSDDINVIVYSDHGMSHDDSTIDINKKVNAVVKDKILKSAHPNLYLKDPQDKKIVAEKLVAETPLDYAFFKKEDKIIGIHQESIVIFKIKEGKISYSYQGQDTFNYYTAGYQGEFLTEEEWLDFSYDLKYPLAPVNIYKLFNNLYAGEIITVLNPPPIIGGGYVRKGNHHGLTAENMTVPILLKGPNLKHLYGRKYMRLDNLFNEIPKVDFEDVKPERNKHSINLNQQFNFTYSPKYRFKLGTDVTNDDDYRFWGLYELYSGHLSKFWLGGGASNQAGEDLEAMAKWKYQLKVNNLGLKHSNSTVDNSTLNLFYKLNQNLELNFIDFESLGVRYRW
ncbi:alkaline phosphatase family protein [Natroniella sulfidigena]|uniref:alkaline phosphatase family protein n=1 Tax=Natroniella sulfidigena TaxID=723921 RepID=UPI00200A9AC9|nr:alkaline phosphatase family protein [Natroniella sulfidigena]MCK8817291.1 alkaline phosphatase family protein [Natroniella sulfidigena]